MKVRFTRTMEYIIDDVRDVEEAKLYLADFDDYIYDNLREDEEVSFTEPVVSVWHETEEPAYALTDKGNDYLDYLHGKKDYYDEDDYDETGKRLSHPVMSEKEFATMFLNALGHSFSDNEEEDEEEDFCDFDDDFDKDFGDDDVEEDFYEYITN